MPDPFIRGLLFGLGLMASGILLLLLFFAIDRARGLLEYLQMKRFYRDKFTAKPWWWGGPRG